MIVAVTGLYGQFDDVCPAAVGRALSQFLLKGLEVSLIHLFIVHRMHVGQLFSL